MVVRNRGYTVLLIVAVLLVGTNCILLYQNLQLRRSVEQSKRYVTDVGYRFREIPGKSLDGEDHPLFFDRDGKSTVLLVFDNNCRYCVQQYPYWKRLVASLDPNNWRIVALTSQTDSNLVRKHLDENDFSGFDVRLVPREELSNARLGFTPMTLVVDSGGVVHSVFPGLRAGDFFGSQ